VVDQLFTYFSAISQSIFRRLVFCIQTTDIARNIIALLASPEVREEYFGLGVALEMDLNLLLCHSVFIVSEKSPKNQSV
jgi:hypothetical protein